MIEQFLQQVEKKAFRIAWMAVKNEQDALDLVQNAMMKLVEKYSDRQDSELKPLFYTILQNQIKNWYRRESLTSKWFFWQKTPYDEDDVPQNIASPEGVTHHSPEHQLSERQVSEKLLEQLQNLPVKQQQCFLLRSWEGLSVRETAKIMDCTEGTVKTHMSRASQKLNHILQQEAG